MTAPAIARAAGSLTTDVLTLEEYARFLGREDTGPSNLYHTPHWLEAVQEGLGMQIVILGFFDADELIGALPGFLVRKWGARLFGAPLRGSMTPYTGWVLKRSATVGSQAVLEQVKTFCTRRLHCHYTEIGLLAAPTDFAAGSGPEGWHVGVRETYMLDLRVGEAALWSAMGQRSRGRCARRSNPG